jgi:hypothetical protein
MVETDTFAAHVNAYLESLSEDDLRALVLRSLRRMDGSQRSQLGMYLGYDISRDPIDEVGAAIDAGQLRAFVESCALLRERFAAFLIDNPRAVPALGRAAQERILGEQERAQRRVLPAKALALAIAAALLALLPLGAEYAHQRGMVSGLDDMSLAQFAPPPVVRRILHFHVARHAAQHPAHHVATFHVHHAARARVVAAAAPTPAPMPVRRARKAHQAPRVAIRRHKPRYVAEHKARRMRRAAGPDLAARARFIVSAYLAAVIQGNDAVALMPLGLPADAPASNLTERAIVTPDSSVQITDARKQADGRVRVDAQISGPRGEYREVFYLMPAGVALRIVDRYYDELAQDAR